MRARRLLVVLAVVGMLALAGCTGGGDSTTTGPGETTDAPTEPTTATETPTQTTTTETPESTPTQTTTTPTLTPVDVPASEVKERAVDATADVEEYVGVFNLSIETRSNNIVQTIGQNSTVRYDNAAMAFHQRIRQSVRGRTVELDNYFVEGALYTRSPTNTRAYGSEWTRRNVTENVTETFDATDELEALSKGLANSTGSVQGATSVDGTPVYVLRADVNESSYAEALEMGNSTTLHEVNATFYVGRDDGRIHRADITLNQTSTVRGQTVDQTVTGVERFQYRDVSVSLPEAASTAVSIGDDANDNETDSDDDSDSSESETDEQTDEGNTSDDGGTTTTGIAVRNGTLAVDPDETFHRVEAALGTNVTDPEAVKILEPVNRSADDDGGQEFRTLADVVGVERVSMTGQNISVGPLSVPSRWTSEVSVSGLGTVRLRSSPAIPTAFVRLLTTHEFVHYVQFQNGRFASVRSATDATSDGSYASNAVTEGAAVFTTDAILDADGREPPRNVDLYEGIEAAVPPGSANALANSWYQEGREYVASMIDDPTELPTVYENPPTTSEQVIHELAPGSEPPVPLNVSVETGGSYRIAGSDRAGEAFLRHALANGVSPDRAAEAAAGWGNDTVRILDPVADGNTSFLWVHRWDDSEEAGEFAETAGDYLDGSGADATTPAGVPAALLTPDERTTVLVIGPETFQQSLTVSVDDATVVVDTA